MTDDLLTEQSIGEVQDASISLGQSLTELDSVMSSLGIDRRTAMPDDESSLEYRLRQAYQHLSESEDELREEAGF